MNDNTTIHRLNPELAKHIARYVNSRSVAADMVNTVLQRKVFRADDFEFWKTDHQRATAELRKLGIVLHTYVDDKEETA
jgi:hypothetical protein